nr:protein kinase superfamily protein [Tanacetum cinerariifolium]
MQKAAQEARLVTLSKAEMIKVVKDVVSEAGVDPKALRGSMGSQEFLKKQDAEFNVLQKEHLEKRIFSTLELKEIPGELRINPSLAPIGQVPSLSSSRKRMALELEPEVRIDGLECNRSHPKGIQFVNSKVIETLKHGIFFIDAFGNQAFQRVSDIHKVEVESLLWYMVMDGNIKIQ